MPAIRRCVNPRLRLYVYFPWVYVQNGSFGCMSAFRRTFEASGPGKVNYSTGTGMKLSDLLARQHITRPGRCERIHPFSSTGFARAPHAWLGEGRSILDLFGRGFVLLQLGPDAPDGAAFESAATARGIPLKRVIVKAPTVAELYGRRLVLVRPDGHVAWRGDEVPPRPADEMARVSGVAACSCQASRTSIEKFE